MIGLPDINFNILATTIISRDIRVKAHTMLLPVELKTRAAASAVANSFRQKEFYCRRRKRKGVIGLDFLLTEVAVLLFTPNSF